MADTLVGDVEITSDGHGCGDVEPVVMPFEVVFEALGQCDAVIFHGQPSRSAAMFVSVSSSRGTKARPPFAAR